MDEHKENNLLRPKQLLAFAKANLPLLIMIAAVVLVFIFFVGSITRAIQGKIYNDRVSDASYAAKQSELEQLTEEADLLLEEAAELARHFDYKGAVALLRTFSGDMKEFPYLLKKYEQYTKALDDLVLWSDPDTIVNLSFHMLIADPQRAYSSYNRSYVTIDEFTTILQQLYANDYILVRLSDFATSNGAKGLYLPAGKKPLVLTQTGVNYYTTMIDSDGDGLADANGSGFASKLVFDENNNITCEMVDSTGATVYGAYDMIPILDAFVETHPDFSYRGAKAVIAVTGYDGLFGYRTNPEAEALLGSTQYQSEIEDAGQIAQALRDTGYELACYTYENEPYADLSAEQISEEMTRWTQEVYPILGFTNIFVFSKNSDIGQSAKSYTDPKLDILYSAGFRYFLGFCQDEEPWFSSHGKYVRQGRILVTGANMAYSPKLFEGLFDPTTVLDPNRGL